MLRSRHFAYSSAEARTCGSYRFHPSRSSPMRKDNPPGRVLCNSRRLAAHAGRRVRQPRTPTTDQWRLDQVGTLRQGASGTHASHPRVLVPHARYRCSSLRLEPGVAQRYRRRVCDRPVLQDQQARTPFNVLGVPAIALPIGMSSQGLAIGIQIVGKPYGEAVVFRAASGLQALQSFSLAPPLESLLVESLSRTT